MNSPARRNVLQALLASTREEGETELGELEKSLNITGEAFRLILMELSSSGLVKLDGDAVKVSLGQRLQIAEQLIRLGGDFQTVSRSLGWLEFEEFVAHVFEENGYNVLRRFRFQAEGRRWEIDVLATKFPYIVCAECKHWTKGIGDAAARKIVEIHKEKTEVFARHIDGLVERIGVHRWKNAVITPMTLSLSPTPMSIYRRVPSLNILVLTSYLEEFQGQLERIEHHRVELPPWKPRPEQTRLG